jgi:hypothetical protein
MFDQLQAARFLHVLSRGRRLTELDAARALNSAARLLSADLVTTTSAVREPHLTVRRGALPSVVPPVVRTAQPPAV